MTDPDVVYDTDPELPEHADYRHQLATLTH